MIGILKPARITERLPPDRTATTYRRLRLQVFGSCVASVALFAVVWLEERSVGA